MERLCDRVGIIAHGQMVASGTIDELRRSETERLWVDVPRAAPNWTHDLPGVKVVQTEGSRSLLDLGASVDDQVVLRAALATGPVREFAREVPNLSELFRDLVTEEPDA